MIETRYGAPRVLHLNITNIETADMYQLDVNVKGLQKKALSLMTPLGLDDPQCVVGVWIGGFELPLQTSWESDDIQTQTTLTVHIDPGAYVRIVEERPVARIIAEVKKLVKKYGTLRGTQELRLELFLDQALHAQRSDNSITMRTLHRHNTAVMESRNSMLRVIVVCLRAKGFRVLPTPALTGFDHASSSQMEELYHALHPQSITVDWSHVDWSVC